MSEEKRFRGGPQPAPSPVGPQAGGQAVGPEVSNERGAREWLWLCTRYGDAAALAALQQAVGRGRRPYPLNAARELGVELPPPDRLPLLPEQRRKSREAASRVFAELQRDGILK